MIRNKTIAAPIRAHRETRVAPFTGCFSPYVGLPAIGRALYERSCELLTTPPTSTPRAPAPTLGAAVS